MMRISLALTLLLLTAVSSQNCNGCKPAPQIATCPDLHCYQCGTNEALNPTTLNCECTGSNYRINGVCGVCPDGYAYDPVTEWCNGINTCGPNQVLVNGTCQCQPGLQVIQNICQRCPVNQTYFAQYDACRCSPGYSSINNSCIIVTCSANQVYSDAQQACVCDFGYYLVNGVCGRCANNEVYNSAAQTCSPLVAPTCGFNEYFYECCCFCQNGYVRISGACNTCPAHSSYDWTTNACVCDQGYYFVGEQVLQLPYQSQDTGSSFTSNPGYAYSAYGPSFGAGASASINQFSNYDASGVNTNGVNLNNVILVTNNGYGN
jgi:hypothetical protein